MKIKKLVLIMVTLLLIFILGVFVYFNYFKEQLIPVLTYHGVVDEVKNPDGVDISTVYFEKQMKWLADNNYNTITMDEFYDWKKGKISLPKKSVLITFDDGWRNTYENALPILEKYNLKSNVFVVWKYEENCTKQNIHIYLDDADILDIKKNHKSMQLLSHSYDLHEHESADSEDYNKYVDDMDIVNQMAGDINYYAYPFGHYNENYEKALKDKGYKIAFTFGPYDFASKESNDYQVPRIGIFDNTPFWKFKLKLLLQI